MKIFSAKSRRANDAEVPTIPANTGRGLLRASQSEVPAVVTNEPNEVIVVNKIKSGWPLTVVEREFAAKQGWLR